MRIEQFRWTENEGWGEAPGKMQEANLVVVFADHPAFHEQAYEQLHGMFPRAHIVGCSSSGSVMETEISDNTIVATAVCLEKSRVRLAVRDIVPGLGAEEVGRQLMSELAAPDLRHVFILSDGLQVNGSDLAKGLNQAGVPVTGGLAGDGTRFGKTWVMADGQAKSGLVAALGFYGEVTVRSGCFAGWEEFGAERVVTKSSGNVVFEIDGQPALDLYKKYLGELASELPASGLRFPLSIQMSKNEPALLRTLLAVDEADRSLTFAGDVPQGYICKLMRTNLDSLIEKAGMAADTAKSRSFGETGLCVVVSCVGRRLVMGQLTEDELEIVREKLGETTAITGFYSYGELAPFSDIMQCQLHNQTMTLTTVYE